MNSDSDQYPPGGNLDNRTRTKTSAKRKSHKRGTSESGYKISSKVLKGYLADLETAKAQFSEGLDGGRRGTISWLTTITSLLFQIDEIREQNLLAPSYVLLDALQTLEEGTTHALLRPNSKKRRGRSTRTRAMIKGFSVFAIELLPELGRTPLESRKMVSSALNKSGFKIGKKGNAVKPGTLTGWKRRVSEDVMAETLLGQNYQNWKLFDSTFILRKPHEKSVEVLMMMFQNLLADYRTQDAV